MIDEILLIIIEQMFVLYFETGKQELCGAFKLAFYA